MNLVEERCSIFDTSGSVLSKLLFQKNVPGYVCNPGSPKERDAASRRYGERHQRCPALNHMCNQSKLTARRHDQDA